MNDLNSVHLYTHKLDSIIFNILSQVLFLEINVEIAINVEVAIQMTTGMNIEVDVLLLFGS